MDGAIRKLSTLVKKVGYPEPSRNYDAFAVNSCSWFENVMAGNRFESDRRVAKIGKPVDRGEWGMTAATNNAYYNPLLNEIVFPAGILQEPLFSVNADLAANYGATGATIGHEITHGFDDEGRQFDENGNLKDWWSQNSTELFNKKAQCLEKQYDQYTVADGVKVQGALTLGENIADLGGLKIALKAYQKASTVVPSKQEYQRFFVAYAQSWCGKATPAYEKNIVQFDPHSPARFRVNGVVVNMPEFAEAFSCQAGQKMNPPQRCEVW
jgi:endothelin-converting enzyme/putative endopeptidase